MNSYLTTNGDKNRGAVILFNSEISFVFLDYLIELLYSMQGFLFGFSTCIDPFLLQHLLKQIHTADMCFSYFLVSWELHILSVFFLYCDIIGNQTETTRFRRMVINSVRHTHMYLQQVQKNICAGTKCFHALGPGPKSMYPSWARAWT